MQLFAMMWWGGGFQLCYFCCMGWEKNHNIGISNKNFAKFGQIRKTRNLTTTKNFCPNFITFIDFVGKKKKNGAYIYIFRILTGT